MRTPRVLRNAGFSFWQQRDCGAVPGSGYAFASAIGSSTTGAANRLCRTRRMRPLMNMSGHDTESP
ncbi:hypothetical protein L0Z13_05045 [Burkholderia multivorans]|uniref:hypothetical protein n=1 Tax=Burkholderia TaxID=32008 RepID=UPI000F771900|nr:MULTISPECIES: hypothetical protein [Burkholderia]EKS9913054.1 hypothetical protein [Burkholderia multivorans]MBH9661222.1 hypothetical protein [Burkholderia multivorans]MBJ9683118.1 hypothetical protein [Burkholderia multivorans]MBU9183758.1 hypothetical protein [Burkholderia multivorans]MBU9253056.1 hypothetical protein [Burkholderia multivorans]